MTTIIHPHSNHFLLHFSMAVCVYCPPHIHQHWSYPKCFLHSSQSVVSFCKPKVIIIIKLCVTLCTIPGNLPIEAAKVLFQLMHLQQHSSPQILHSIMIFQAIFPLNYYITKQQFYMLFCLLHSILPLWHQ